MRQTVYLVAILVICICIAKAREPSQMQGDTTKALGRNGKAYHPSANARASAEHPSQKVPSIIQSELDRSRAEDSHMRAKNVPVEPQSAPPVQTWPLALALCTAGLATGGAAWYVMNRRKSQTAPAPAPRQEMVQVPVEYVRKPEPVFEPADPFGFEMSGTNDVASASPYVSNDDSEMPEAALTMNLLNKKRETKKDVILEVMKRVQRHEKPQQIAEDLRIGVGEVHLAMTLAKLKK